MTRRVTIATNNSHKLEEISQILGEGYQLSTLADIGCNEELAEDQDTLEGNSLQKAKYVFDKYGVSALADDSGLEVDSLSGAPGVYSARYAGPQRNSADNIAKLLNELQPHENRSAQFRAVITLIDKNGTHAFEGVLRGSILKALKGDGGFGYDPVFVPEGYSKTLAEMSPEEKNRISHRAVALQKLKAYFDTQAR